MAEVHILTWIFFFLHAIEVKFREGKQSGISLEWMRVCLPRNELCLPQYSLSVTNSFLPCKLCFFILKILFVPFKI